ncbi:DUF536 domain-containing protein [Enterococcus sp. 669A]|uniref:DUF536 domain-containing protein n=1 Tax=Candidatus Enterococcus moelleringii TaxID=2815325 RepID=A0ABS3L5X5_9ENTE|nr:DUF536 domain-containing protein [Enterococcus sp. 669A]MBO1305022.1 DUF536 domain-containing protein [Enterococcus sp. 669A]
MGKALEQLAEELQVGKGEIKKILYQLEGERVPPKNQGAFMLSEEQEKVVRLMVTNHRLRKQPRILNGETIVEDTETSEDTPTVGEFILEQLDKKDQVIAKMQKLLDQQQQLSLEDKRMMRMISNQSGDMPMEIPFLDERVVEALVIENKQLKQENQQLKQREKTLVEEKQRVTDNLNYWMNYYSELQKKYDELTEEQSGFLKKRWGFK